VEKVRKNLVNFIIIFMVVFTFTIQHRSSVLVNRYSSDNMGYYQILDNQVSYLENNQKEEVNLVELGVIITANLSSSFWAIAIYNNSVLYAKTHVFVYVNDSLEQVITDKSISVFSTKIPSQNIKIVIRIKWVSGFKDIEEIEQEFQGITVSQEYLIKVAITGIPAFILAFVIMVIVVWYRKRIFEIKEGFEDE